MFDNDQVNYSLGTMKELEESTPKPDGDGTLRRGGNHLKNVAGMELGRTVNFFFNFVNPNCKVFRLQALTILL